MLLTELVDALDSTIERCRQSRPRKRAVVFTVHSSTPHLLGQAGWRMPDDEHDPRPLYGFTLQQVTRMREVVEQAAREDAGLDAGR